MNLWPIVTKWDIFTQKQRGAGISLGWSWLSLFTEMLTTCKTEWLQSPDTSFFYKARCISFLKISVSLTRHLYLIGISDSMNLAWQTGRKTAPWVRKTLSSTGPQLPLAIHPFPIMCLKRKLSTLPPQLHNEGAGISVQCPLWNCPFARDLKVHLAQ